MSGKRKHKRTTEDRQIIRASLLPGRCCAVLPAVPGFLSCVSVAVILVLDVLPLDMSERQYVVFPLVYLAINITAALCGTVFIVVKLRMEKIKKDAASFLFAAFAVMILLSTAINGLTREAVHGIPYRNIGIFGMLLFLVVYYGVSAQITIDALREKIILVYMAVADLVGLSALWDRYIIEIPAYHAKKELSAVFFNGNHYGYFLLMAVLLGLGWYMYGEDKKLYFGIATMILNIFLLMINHSMGCILSLVAVMVMMVISILRSERDRSRRLIILCCLALACLAAAVIFSLDIREEFISLKEDISGLLSNSTNGTEGHNRLILWSLTWGYIKEYPLLGSGCEAIAFDLQEVTGRSNPHNELLTYAAYYGIPAAICYASGVISVFVQYFRHRANASAAVKTAVLAATGYFISSMFGVAMFYTTPLFFVFLGIASCVKEGA